MKKSFLAIVLAGVVSPCHAVIWNIDLSGLGGSGLSSANEVGANTSAGGLSSATGGEISTGITYDDVANQLSFNAVVYGSAHGFVDLQGTFTGTHIHGPATQSSTAGVRINLDSGATDIHTVSGDLKSGFFNGTISYTETLEAELFAGSQYLNVHSTAFPGGEIRGQLIATTPVPEPHEYALVASLGLLGFAAWRRRAALAG